MGHTGITFEKVLERMKDNELKEIIKEKVRNMGFSKAEIERYFANSEELLEVAEKY